MFISPSRKKCGKAVYQQEMVEGMRYLPAFTPICAAIILANTDREALREIMSTTAHPFSIPVAHPLQAASAPALTFSLHICSRAEPAASHPPLCSQPENEFRL